MRHAGVPRAEELGAGSLLMLPAGNLNRLLYGKVYLNVLQSNMEHYFRTGLGEKIIIVGSTASGEYGKKCGKND